MSTDDISVGLKVRAETQQLRETVALFKEGKASLQDLQSQTKTLKNDTKDLNDAYRQVSRGQRIQTFELSQTIRIVRSATSLFSSLNSVFQTLYLRQIATNQRTTEQREAFEKVSKVVANFGDNLGTLGSKSIDVQNQLDKIVGHTKGLSSADLSSVIDEFEKLRQKHEDGTEEAKTLDEAIKNLKLSLAETKQKELGDAITDWGSLATNILTAAGAIGSFILQLRRLRGGRTSQPAGGTGGGLGLPTILTTGGGGKLGAAAGTLAIALILPPILQALDEGFQALTGGYTLFPRFGEAGGETSTPKSRFAGSSRFGQAGIPTKVEVNINEANIRNEADLYKLGQEIIRRLQELLGFKVQ